MYEQLVKLLESRKIPAIGTQQATQLRHVRVMEVEREFLEAFAVIVQSSYFIEETDFHQLLATL